MSDGVDVRVWDDRDERWARRFTLTLPDGTTRPGGLRLRELRERAVDGVVELPSPRGGEPARIPLDAFADDDPEHTLLAVGFRFTERIEPPPGANVWRPPPPPPDLQALHDELRPLQEAFRAARDAGDEDEQRRLEPLIEAAWERIEAHPEHRGWRERATDYVELAPGIRVWDTRRDAEA